MPCQDYGVDAHYEAERARELREAQAEVDRLIRMLCSLCRAAETNIEFPHNVGEWWRKHRIEDDKRIARNKKRAIAKRRKREEVKRKEALAKQARAKLTPEELKALTEG